MRRFGTAMLPVTRRTVFGLAASLATGLASQGAAAQSGTPVAASAASLWSFTDDRGVTSTLAETPQRIVAFSPVANPAWLGDLAFFRELRLDIIVPETEDRWQILSWEEAARYQPDLYLVDARSGEVPPELAQIPTWQAQPAVQAGQVAPWPAVYAYGRQAYTPILTAVTQAIQSADPDVVP